MIDEDPTQIDLPDLVDAIADSALDELGVAPSTDASALGQVPFDIVADAQAFDPSSWSASAPIESTVMPWGEFPAASGADATSLMWTAPTGEVALLNGLDMNGDGVVDLVSLDANGDGLVDTWLVDMTGQPSPATGENFADTMFVDTTGTGTPDCCCVDPTGAGDYSDAITFDGELAETNATQVPDTAPAPVPEAAPVTPAVAEPAAGTTPLETSDPLLNAMTMTDDPATISALKSMMAMRTRMPSYFL